MLKYINIKLPVVCIYTFSNLLIDKMAPKFIGTLNYRRKSVQKQRTNVQLAFPTTDMGHLYHRITLACGAASLLLWPFCRY